MPDKPAIKHLDLNDPHAQQELRDAFPEHILVISQDDDGPLAMLYPKDQCIIGESAGCGYQVFLDEISMCEPVLDEPTEDHPVANPVTNNEQYPQSISNRKGTHRTREKPPDRNPSDHSIT